MTSMEYFTGLYAADDDPWHLQDNPYEDRKYALTVASLPRPSYERAFEPGCSIGTLTARLHPRCDHLLAVDAIPAAVAATRRRVPDTVEVRAGAVPRDWPDGHFDLIVLSELLYFLTPSQRDETVTRTIASLRDGGHVAAVHWRHGFAEAATAPDDAHAELQASPSLRRIVEHVESDFRLEVFEHEPRP